MPNQIIKSEIINGIKVEVIKTRSGYVIEAAGRRCCDPRRDMQAIVTMYIAIEAMCKVHPEAVQAVANQ